MSYRFLDKIDSPADLKSLDVADLPLVCEELRQFIIESEAVNPAHFGANLGVIELTVALHYVFDVPNDNLIWDVGHQAYGHKILTGRRDAFKTNRKYKGISGFPSPAESKYDSFGVGHSSTSISAALGMAMAAKMRGSDERTIAVIGDGALTGGEAFEALNNAAVSKPNLLIVLNDNKIAIDETPGSLREYLTDIATSKTYNKVKNDVWRLLGKVGPDIRHFTQRIDNAVKSVMMKQGNLFESMGVRYFGPVACAFVRGPEKYRWPQFVAPYNTKGQGIQAGRGQSAALACSSRQVRRNYWRVNCRCRRPNVPAEIPGCVRRCRFAACSQQPKYCRNITSNGVGKWTYKDVRGVARQMFRCGDIGTTCGDIRCRTGN